MDSPSALAVAMVHTQSGENSELRGRWLTLARAAWVTIALLTAILFLAGVPASFEYLQTACTEPTCDGPQPTPSMVRELSRLGLSVSLYAAFLVALDVVFALVCFALSGLIVWHRPTSQPPMLAALALITFGAVTFPNVLNVLAEARPAFALPVAVAGYAGHVSFLMLFYLFPDGSFVPRWTRPLALLWAVLGIPRYFAPGTPLDLHASPAGFVPMYLGFLGTAIFAQVYRYRRVSRHDQRQQTKWVVFGFVAAMFTFLVFILVGSTLPPSLDENPFGFLVANAIMYLSMLLIPVTIGIAILRYRLWEIDVIINRTLVYGSLTGIVIGLYVLIVGGLGAILQARGNLVISLVATGLIAVAFQPLRDRLQRTVNRLMYGEREEPYRIIARLGRRLEATLNPLEVLQTIVHTLSEALRLPYAAIELKQEGGYTLTASAGQSSTDPLRLPLTYHGEELGRLVMGPRIGEGSFTASERRLLEDLARQAGVAVHAVRLTSDLQLSRERLVTAREEERRRLQRDLHDGLGPTLASLFQRLDTASVLVRSNPEDAVALLGDLKGRVKTTIADVRRLVYALRPPALDEFGLVSAVREHAAQLNGSDGLCIAVEAPEKLPPLPAAVEVAAYRIVFEALANVVRHAQARTCRIWMTVDDDALCVEIADDGTGLLPDQQAGVGITSMRERAAELGGELRIESGAAGGTLVRTRLPLGKG